MTVLEKKQNRNFGSDISDTYAKCLNKKQTLLDNQDQTAQKQNAMVATSAMAPASAIILSNYSEKTTHMSENYVMSTTTTTTTTFTAVRELENCESDENQEEDEMEYDDNFEMRREVREGRKITGKGIEIKVKNDVFHKKLKKLLNTKKNN